MSKPWRRDRRSPSVGASSPPPSSDVDAGVEPEAESEVQATPDVAGELDALSAEVMDDLASIDSADSELVLHRAIELADQPVVVAEQFPVANLEEVAAELHIPVPAVAEALAEYRAGALTPSEDGRARRLAERLVGPGQVTVRHRTGLPEQVAVDRISEWLKRRHRLRIRVNAKGAVVGVRRRGVVSAAMRQVRTATGNAGLSGVKEVRGAAVSVAEGHTAICVVADVSEMRTQSMVTGSVVAIGGAAVVSTAAVVTAPVTLVGVPMMVGAGWVATRLAHRRQLRRVTEEVEMTADEVAAGAQPPTLVQGITDRIDAVRSRRSSGPTPRG